MYNIVVIVQVTEYKEHTSTSCSGCSSQVQWDARSEVKGCASYAAAIDCMVYVHHITTWAHLRLLKVNVVKKRRCREPPLTEFPSLRKCNS